MDCERDYCLWAGIGVAITANKLKGSAACCDTFSARCARAHNDANILTLGARVIDQKLLEIVDIF